jgi:hypothetical protein
VPTFVDGYTRKFEKFISVIVKALMGLIFRKNCQGDDLVKFVLKYVVAWIAPIHMLMDIHKTLGSCQ